MSVTLFGAAAFRAAIDASLDLARLAEARVREHPELELLSPAQLGIVCFRRRFPGGEHAQDARNAALVRAFAASGRGLVSSTRLHGAYAIRLCALNHASTAADVEATLEWLATADAPPAPLGTARGIGRPGARQATMAEAESGVGVEPQRARDRAAVRRARPAAARCSPPARAPRRARAARRWCGASRAAATSTSSSPAAPRSTSATASCASSSRATSSASSRRSTGAPTTATRGSPPWSPRPTCGWPS